MAEDRFEPLGDERIFIDPSAYGRMHEWHAKAARLRAANPLPRVEVPGYVPFRAVTLHRHVAEIERNHALFYNTRDSILFSIAETEGRRRAGIDVKTLSHMDGAEHRSYRAITHDWFKPANLRKTVEESLPALARRFVDRMLEHGGRCDFARDIALHYPLRVIMKILGVPDADHPRMLDLTQKIFGAQDPEVAAGGDHAQVRMQGLLDMAAYFQRVTDDRRARPTEDVASTIANAKIDGEYLPDMEISGYYAIVATAGHDTTASSLAGGLEALIRNPAELEALRQDPSLIPNAVDEITRWVTPVRHFMRQARGDYDLEGTKLRAGDWLLLSYVSANRDETVFDDPFRFDVRRRNAGDHLAFGIGIHFCLGAHLARMELRAFLEELIPRLDAIELDGSPEYVEATFIGGPKRLPVRYRLRPHA